MDNPRPTKPKRGIIIGPVYDMNMAVEAFYSEMDAFLSKDIAEREGVMTGFFALDYILDGCRNNELLVLGGRPRVGKTSLVLNIARNMAVQFNQAVCIFSNILCAMNLFRHILTSHTQIDYSTIRKNTYTRAEMQKLVEGTEQLQKAPLWLCDSEDMSLEKLKDHMRLMHAKHDLKLIIIDRLQMITLLPPESGVFFGNQLDDILRGLKGMTNELGIPILVTSNLSRRCDRRRDYPRITDLYGPIEDYVDIVLLQHRESYYRTRSYAPCTDMSEIIVAKNKFGLTGACDLHFTGPQMRFDNPSIT